MLFRSRNKNYGMVFDGAMEYVGRMKWFDKSWVLGLSGILLATAARADGTEPADNPYQVILDRNPFGLKPAPIGDPIKPPTNTVPPNVKLTGITSDSTGRKAWLMIPAAPGKNPQYFSISEHEKQGEIEVVEIDEKENSVKILNAGAALELNFKDNGLPTPVAPVVPGVSPHPGAMPVPGIVPAPGLPPPAIKTAGTTPTVSGATDALAARYGLQPGAVNPVRTIPARNVRTQLIEPQAQTTAPIDPAIQQIMLEAQKAHGDRTGQVLPPVPPK